MKAACRVVELDQMNVGVVCSLEASSESVSCP